MSLSPTFFGAGAGTPVQVLVGRGAATFNLTRFIDLFNGGITIEDSGNNVDATARIDVVDIYRVINELAPEGKVLIKQGDEERFRGFIRSFEPTAEGLSNRVSVNCVGVSSLLDKCIIPPEGVNTYKRTKRESDRARIIWLLKTFGQPFLDHAANDFTKIQVLETAMEKQDFHSLTLRQAIEQVLGAASRTANYYIDQAGRLHTFDKNNPENLTAPFEVNQAHALAANECPVANFRVMWDSSELVNYYYIQGADKSGSGAFSDADSVATYGRRQAFLSGPDSDNAKKAQRLASAALTDTKDPLPRISFTVSDQYITNSAGTTWAPGQMVYMTSPSMGWNRYSERIIRVTTRFLDGLGTRAMDIEAGALKRLFGGYYAPYAYNPARPATSVTIPEPDISNPPPAPPPPVISNSAWYVIDDFERDIAS